MAAPPAKTELADTYPSPSNATFRTGIGKLWDYATGLLGSTGDAEGARAALGVGLSPCVRGLRGNVNSATPLTKFDLSADMVALRDADGATVTRYSAGTLTCDIGASGITASSWVHIYYVWDGASLALHPSTVPPASFTASDLPASNTHWCYATTVRWNSSSNIVASYARGSRVFYGAAQAAITGGTQATETAIDLSSFVPSNALLVTGGANGYLLSSSAGVGNDLSIRVVSGSNFLTTVMVVETANGYQGFGYAFEIPNINQNLYYLWSSATATRNANISVTGYTIPNGDS